MVSAASCKAQSALTPAHLEPFLKGQPQVTYLLSKLGCWCIVNPKASMVAQLSGTQELVLAALTAAAQSKDMPLQQFVSKENLGPIDFCSICQMLLNIKTSSANRRQVTDFLSQCTLFEDMHGKQLSLAQQPDVRVMSSKAWEQSIAASPDLLPWTVIKYHSATKTQQELLKKAGRGDVDTIKFLDDLLPELYSSASVALDPEQQVKLEHLLGQVVASLASEPTARLQQPLQLVVGGRLQRVKMLVDSSSSLLKDLFSKDSGYTEYDLLPGVACLCNTHHSNVCSSWFFVVWVNSFLGSGAIESTLSASKVLLC